MLKHSSISIVLILMMLSLVPAAHAEGFREAGASLLLPTTGQSMNGELGTGKTKLMAGIEVAAITTVTIAGFAAGGPIVWLGAAPLIANHVWSATDAYKGAKRKATYYSAPADQQQLYDAQRTLELSREDRFNREQASRNDLRERMRLASEQANA